MVSAEKVSAAGARVGGMLAFPGNHRKHLASGYLKKGNSLPDLAKACGIDVAQLSQTVARFNDDAEAGHDSAFGKGSTTYQTYLGDPENKPNPCLRPLEGPFYAIEIMPGDIGTSMGLDIDQHARVKRADGTVIEAIYACGNDINSIMSGAYPGAGITLGPALTFGYIAGTYASGSVAEGDPAVGAGDALRAGDILPAAPAASAAG